MPLDDHVFYEGEYPKYARLHQLYDKGVREHRHQAKKNIIQKYVKFSLSYFKKKRYLEKMVC